MGLQNARKSELAAEPRYGTQDLFLPKDFHTEIRPKLVSPSDDHVPFNRQVDLWWYALTVGVKLGRKTAVPRRDEIVKFNDAGILESDPWRITQLELLVMSEQGEDAASNPSTVIQTGNEYAFTGCRVLGAELRGKVDPQLHLLSRIGQT